MIYRFAKGLAASVVANGLSTEEDSDMYTHAFENLINNLLNILIGVALSVRFGKVIEGAVFMSSFAVLRCTTGGHHAETHLGCMAAFSMILAVALTITKFFPTMLSVQFVTVTAIISTLVVFKFAPVEHHNKPLFNEKRGKLKHKSRVLVVGVNVANLVATVMLNSAVCLMVSLALLAVSGIIMYTVKFGKGGSSNEKGR